MVRRCIVFSKNLKHFSQGFTITKESNFLKSIKRCKFIKNKPISVYKYIFFFSIWLFLLPLSAQNKYTASEEQYFVVRGSVKEKFSNEPSSEVTVTVNGGH